MRYVNYIDIRRLKVVFWRTTLALPSQDSSTSNICLHFAVEPADSAAMQLSLFSSSIDRSGNRLRAGKWTIKIDNKEH